MKFNMSWEKVWHLQTQLVSTISDASTLVLSDV